MTTTLRTAVVAFAALVILAGCTSGSSPPTQPSPAATAPTSSPSVSDPAMRLEGVWRSPMLSRAAIEAALGRAGLQKHAAIVLKEVAAPEVFSLSFAFGTYSLTRSSLESVDSGKYQLVGSRLRLIPCTGCSADFTVTIDGDTLRLELERDTSPPFHGVPDAAFVTAFYESAEFTRV